MQISNKNFPTILIDNYNKNYNKKVMVIILKDICGKMYACTLNDLILEVVNGDFFRLDNKMRTLFNSSLKISLH